MEKDNQLLSENKLYSLNLTYNFCALKNLQFRFQEKNLNLKWDSNRGSPDLVWRSEVQIPVQVQICLLKSK